jgi:hypothetical protein
MNVKAVIQPGYCPNATPIMKAVQYPAVQDLALGVQEEPVQPVVTK